MKTACARLVVIVLLICSMFTGCLKRETPVQAAIRTQTLLVDPMTFLDLFVTGGGFNSTSWSNADDDRLISDGARTAQPRARFELFQQAERLLLEEAPVAPLTHGQWVYLIHPAVKGWKPALLGFNRYKDIVLEDQPRPTSSPDTQ